MPSRPELLWTAEEGPHPAATGMTSSVRKDDGGHSNKHHRQAHRPHLGPEMAPRGQRMPGRSELYCGRPKRDHILKGDGKHSVKHPPAGTPASPGTRNGPTRSENATQVRAVLRENVTMR